MPPGNSRLLNALVLFALLPFGLGAQSVRGTVRDSAGRPVAEADVIVPTLNLRTRTDSSGRFQLRGVKVGSHELRVRKIEFRLYAEPLVIWPGATLDLKVQLKRLPPLLQAVTARVDADLCPPSSIEGFECRRLAGEGMYRDAGQIRALRPEHWADMFDGMPGIRRRMMNGPYGREWRIESRPSRCLVELWNGQRKMEVPPDGLGGFPPDQLWRPIDVIAIEYYDDYSKVPIRFQSDAWPMDSSQPCELVIYWLRGAAKK